MYVPFVAKVAPHISHLKGFSPEIVTATKCQIRKIKENKTICQSRIAQYKFIQYE
jgi:hypothetical protein